MTAIKPLLALRNEYDDSDVTLTASTRDNKGPFIVEVIYHDPAICTTNVREEFALLGDAITRFTEAVTNEIEAVEDDMT